MYCPYLRGKQFELIAIRELIEEENLSKNIVPIIEPVTLSPTLISTLNKFIEDNHKIIIINNPTVGSFNEDLNDESKDKYINDYELAIKKDDIMFAYKTDINSDFTDVELVNRFNDSILILEDPKVIELLNNNSIEAKYSVIPDKRVFRRVIGDKILLIDNFIKADRNADYVGEEFFSADHIYYKEDGYVGFSDYSIIGEDYSESGFAPYAVAIHILYFDKDKNLRVIHFVSDTNHGPTNPAKKYHEAVEKLSEWYFEQIEILGEDHVCEYITTNALLEFINHYKTGNYSGLGVVKKLSLKHHLELLGRFLEEEQ